MRAARWAARQVVLAWMAAGCYTWGPGPSNINALERGTVYPEARVVLHDGRAFMLADAQLGADSLTARRSRSDEARGKPYGGAFAAAMGDVQTLHVARYSALRTVGLVVAVPLIALGSLVALVIIACATGPCITT